MKDDILLELYDYCGKKYNQKVMSEMFNMNQKEFPYHIEGIDKNNVTRNYMDWFVLEKIIPETEK